MVEIGPGTGLLTHELLKFPIEKLIAFEVDERAVTLLTEEIHDERFEIRTKDFLEADLEALQAEFLILIKAWDDTFSQTVNQRYSYRYDEIVWNAHFTRAFAVDDEGDLVLSIDRVGSHELV